MNILLISVNNEREPYPVAPLGLQYIAGALRRCGHDIRMLDLCFVPDDEAAVISAIREQEPQLIGISLRNIDNLTWSKSVFYLPRVRQIAERIKNQTGAPIVVGGAGFSLFPEEVLRYLGLEFGIAGEGERAFPLLADAVAAGGSLDDIPNLCRLRNDLFRRSGIEYLPSIGRPYRSLPGSAPYLELGGMGNVQTKRGCPFGCSYCTYPEIEGRALRLREPGAVADEIEELVLDHRARHLFFVDDIFNFPEEHAVGLCEEMVRREVPVEWTCFATPLGMTADMAALMKKAGCSGVEFGSDAAAEKTLQGLHKPFGADDIAHAADACRSVGLPNAHYIILGGPGEDPGTIHETCSLFERVHPTAVIALPGVRIYPGTELCGTAVRDGVIPAGSSLLEPVFYLSPDVQADEMMHRIGEYAKSRPNWIVPALDIRCDAAMMAVLRKMGKTGPLWNMLERSR